MFDDNNQSSVICYQILKSCKEIHIILLPFSTTALGNELYARIYQCISMSWYQMVIHPAVRFIHVNCCAQTQTNMYLIIYSTVIFKIYVFKYVFTNVTRICNKSLDI